MIDASIPLGGGNRQDPIREVLAQIQEHKLGQLKQQMYEQQLAQGQQAQAEDAQLKQLLAGGAQGQDLVSQLTRAGHLDKANALQKQLNEQETFKLERNTKIGGLMKTLTGQVLANPTEQNAIAALDHFQQLTGENVDSEKANIYSMRNNPEGIMKWAAGHSLNADQLLPKVETKDLGGTLQTQQVDPITGKVTVTGNQAKTQSPDSLASNQLTREGHQIQMRGQNMTAETARLNREAAANTASEKLAAKQLQGESSGAYFETAVDSLNRLKEHKALGQAVGIRSMFPTIPGSGAADFEAQLDTFKAQTFVPMVAALKGMGALSDAEGKKLGDAVGALSLKQNKEDFISSANRIQKDLENAYKRTTGKQMPGTEPQTFNSMPDPANFSGKRIQADDGTIYKSNGKKWMRE